MPATSHPVRAWNRVDGIDLLRGLSILLVLCNHVNMRLLGAHIPYTHGLPDQLVYTLVWNGQFGVQIFFVISGFLITSTSIRRWGSPAHLHVRAFYLLRAARIAPLLLALVALLSILHLARVPGFVVSPGTGGLPRALLAALTFHVNWLEATRGYLPPSWDILWSLSVEEVFYLAFPLVARALPRRRFLYPLLALLLVLGPFARARAFNHNPVWREYSYLGGMDAIALGCLTAMLLAGRQQSRRAILTCGTLGAILLVFSLCFSIRAYTWGLGRNGLNMSVLALGAALLIAASTESRWQAPKVLRPLQILGQRSYEIYLTHIFAVLGLFALFLRLDHPLRLVPALFVTAILSAGLLGWLVAVLFAEPANQALRRRLHLGASTLGSALPLTD